MADDEKRTTVSLRLPPDLIARLDEWCAAQRVPVKRTAVIETALIQFLAREGKAKPKS